MKSVLLILTQANLTTVNCNESVTAGMLLATFGLQVKILLQPAALSLLCSDLSFQSVLHAFKPASNYVDSFEYYDLYPILVERQHREHAWVQASPHPIELVEPSADWLAQFDHILTW